MLWTLYEDDGSEGHSSCYSLVTTEEAYSFASASHACAAKGGHLITFGAGPDAGLWKAVANSTFVHTPVRAWAGCHQLPRATLAGQGWRWVDNTTASLPVLNCASGGRIGCGYWATNAPSLGPGTQVVDPADAHVRNFCAWFNGTLLTQASPVSSALPFMCEIDLVSGAVVHLP